MEKSVLNNLDPYNVWNAKTDLYISTGYQIMPGMSYQNPDRTGAVLAAYSSALNDGAILNEIAAQVGTEANYLRELVSVDYSTYSQILTITVMGEDPEFVDGVMEALLGQMEAVKGNITDIISSHTVTTIARSSYNSVSTSLMDRQKANTDQLTELENRIEALQLDRQKLDNAFQTDTDAWNNVEEPVIGGAASSLAKYLLIGFLLGGVLACGVVVVRFLLDGMVYSASELNRSTGLPVLGALASDRTKKAGKLDAKLYQMEGRPDGSADAEMLCLMAQTIRSRAPEAKNILVTGDLPADQLEALAAALQATEPLRGQSVTAAESILKRCHRAPCGGCRCHCAGCRLHGHPHRCRAGAEREDRSAGQADPGLHRIRINNQNAAGHPAAFLIAWISIGRQLPGIEGLVQVVAVPADLYEQAAGGQILIVEPVAEQDRAGEAGVQALHGGFPGGGKTEVEPVVGQADRGAVVAPADDHHLRRLPPVDGAHRGHAGAVLSLDGIPVDIQHDLDAGILR